MVPLRVYSKPKVAFIFQVIVGLLCLLGILLVSGSMIAIWALLAFRPFLLSKRTAQDPAPYWQFYYRIGKISFLITAITLVLFYVVSQLFGNLLIALGIDPKIWVPAVLPYFIVVHGIAGLINADKFVKA